MTNKIESLINKWQLNKGMLADKIEMPLGVFCNKLDSKKEDSFTEEELIKLKVVLKELQTDIDNDIELFKKKKKEVIETPKEVDSTMPTDEQVYCWWIHYQWGLGASQEYFEGLEDGFTGGIQWMIDEGYLQLTEEGKKYKPEYKK